MSKVAIQGNASGSGVLTIAAPNTSTDRTLTLPDNTGTIITTGSTFAGTGPAFSAYQSSAQTLSSNTATKLTFTTEEFDTNNCFASSTFTPTVAGYYQIISGMEIASSATGMLLYVYKNGANYKKLTNANPASISGVNGCAIVYCNGSTDYIEIYGLVATGQALVAASVSTYFQASMVRAA